MGSRSTHSNFARSLVRRSVAAAIILGSVRAAGAQGAAALLLGDVVSREAGNPLGHSTVTLLGVQRQTFSSESGAFAFASVEPGTYRIRAVHIGYTPAEVTVEVTAGVAPSRVRIELSKISLQLATVRIVAGSECTRPGRPNPEIDPEFAAIVAQLRLNAEQYQLLSDSFPFRYNVEQRFQSMRADSSHLDPRIETVAFRSDLRGWEYKMGDVVARTRDGRTMMHLPTLRDFAGYDFLNNHCFRYAGLDSTRDGILIHIEFKADVQIRSPDVDGSVYLDAKTYQIRRADLQLTKIPPGLPQVTAVRVTTIFGEISPSIVVIQDVHGITALRHAGFMATVAMTEDQHSYGFEWLRADPARSPARP
jgi:hypothetical protein